jgi:hypothetical protein
VAAHDGIGINAIAALVVLAKKLGFNLILGASAARSVVDLASRGQAGPLYATRSMLLAVVF